MSSDSKKQSLPLLIAYALVKGPKDSKMIRVIVDTGATTTIIPPQVALAIGCDPARARSHIDIFSPDRIDWASLTLSLLGGVGLFIISLFIMPKES